MGTSPIRPLLLTTACLVVAVALPHAQALRPAVSGTVLTSDAPPKPVVRAFVTLGSGASARSTLTDAGGNFQFRDVPPGQYPLSVAKAGYLNAAYGATQPGGAGVPIVVTAGRDLGDLQVALIPSAAISGVVRDQRGNPMAGAPVSALRWSYAPGGFIRGTRGLVAAPGVRPAVTDERGAYRLYDLPPGDYVVSVPERQLTSDTAAIHATTTEDVERARQILAGRVDLPLSPRTTGGVAFAQTFHPGTMAVSQAVTVRVTPGDQRVGADIVIKPERTAAVDGNVAAGPGQTFQKPPQVRIQPVDRSLLDVRTQSARVTADGSFVLPRLFAGAYVLHARAILDASAGGAPTHWARTEIAIGDSDVTGIQVTLRPTVTLTGRVQFLIDPGLEAPSPEGVGLSLIEADQTSLYEIPSGKAGADGALEIRGITPSRYRIGSTELPTGWRVKSITAGSDLDLMDANLTIPASGQVPPLLVTYTKHTTELNGTLEEASGKPATAYTVVVFAPERAYWTAQTRRVQAVRPGTDGSFTFANLPAGPYLMVAVTGVEPDQWVNPDFLATLVAAGVKITIPDGGKVRQDLRIAR